MDSAARRFLLVDDEPALLFSLRNYLTFRGCLVDCSEQIDDARALARHLRYDVVIVGISQENVSQARSLVREIRLLHPASRVVALTGSGRSLIEAEGGPFDVDLVLGRQLPANELVGALCNVIVV